LFQYGFDDDWSDIVRMAGDCNLARFGGVRIAVDGFFAPAFGQLNLIPLPL
jgi:hypothetical protein